MIRTVVTPTNEDLHLSIPKDYIGKQIEVLLFSIDEIKKEKVKKPKINKLRGSLNLSEEQYKDFQEHAKNIRNEWESNI